MSKMDAQDIPLPPSPQTPFSSEAWSLPPPTPIKRNSRFYFDDRLITFKVEDEVFKIPIRHFLIHSPDIFQGMIEQIPAEGEQPQGSSDYNPVILEGVTIEDFEALVGYFNQDLSDFSDSKEEWISILRLADMWSMDRVRRTACEKLYHHTLGAVEMLELADKYHVPYQWAAPAFHQLVCRPTGLTVQEGQRINPKWAIAIAYVQHLNRAQYSGYSTNYTVTTKSFTAETVLASITAALKAAITIQDTQSVPSSTFPNGAPTLSNADWGITSNLRTRQKKGKQVKTFPVDLGEWGKWIAPTE
ncbi:hypothetical protein DL96DRAFT_1607496 [Flagelloscypha sp. PMI_526]|nr:hypothetical protein DL96DRAFT_1607496 [Flagelloscypha sp. PMI_526]